MARTKKTKAGAAPQAKGSVAGHNGDPALDESRRSRFVNVVAKIMDLQAKMEALRGQIRNQRKELKHEGFEAFEIDYAIKLRRNDEDDMLQQRRGEYRIAVWLGHPVGTQADLFGEDLMEIGGQPRVGNGRYDPVEMGRIAGAEGSVCKPPPNLHQDDAQRWITGWQKGQAALASKGIKAPDVRPDFE